MDLFGICVIIAAEETATLMRRAADVIMIAENAE